MRRNAKLLLVVVFFAAIGLVTGTGAFDTVSAQRSADVGVAGDESALLALVPYDGPNGNGGASHANSDGFARLEDGTLELNLGGYEDGTPQGLGINKGAVTNLQNVFVITNQVNQVVAVSVVDSDAEGADTEVTFYNSQYAKRNKGGLEPDEGGAAVALGPGESIVVSIYIDTRNVADSNSNIVEGITISADADAVATANPGPGNDKQ